MMDAVAGSRTRYDRRTPSPPRNVPDPPLSGMSPYSTTRTGYVFSITSAGVFLVLPMRARVPFVPSR